MADTKISNMTANTTPATTDIFTLVDDPSGTPATQKMTFADLLKVVNGLTEDTAPDTLADFILTYDVSASAPKKVKPQYILIGKYNVTGLIAFNNTTTPNTKYDFDADIIQLRNPTTGTISIVSNPSSITCDITLPSSGSTSTANGCDQSKISALTSQWVHFYYIYNGTTLATLASLTAPPTGPTLPSGYISWAYIGAVYLNSSSALMNMRGVGNTFFYVNGDDNSALQVLSGGTATTETAISLTTTVPPNATTFLTHGFPSYTNSSLGNNTLTFRFKSGSIFASIFFNLQVVNVAFYNQQTTEFPNVGQNLYYLWTGAIGTRSADLRILGYRVSNGG